MIGYVGKNKLQKMLKEKDYKNQLMKGQNQLQEFKKMMKKNALDEAK